MSAVPPRIHFVELLSTSGAAGGQFGWRLLGSNNRELGRGSLAAPSVESAASLVADLVRRLPDVTVQHLRAPSSDGWSWCVSSDDVEMAHSGRTFRRERESLDNADNFRLSLPLAHLKFPGAASRLPQARLASFLTTRTGAVVA